MPYLGATIAQKHNTKREISAIISTCFAILKKWTTTTSKKILDKRFMNVKDLTNVSENRSSDTKHLNDLLATERLLIKMKENKAVKDLEQIRNTFQANVNQYYE